MKSIRSLLLTLAIVWLASPAQAATIYVIDSGFSGHSMVQAAEAHLNALGHTVSTGGTLASYLGFDQVWDLRYGANLGAGDVTSFGAYLAAGGSVYMTGEHSGFDGSRNNSLVSFLSSIGAGFVTLASPCLSGLQPVTGAGAVVNSPNPVGSVSYGCARESTAGNGFLVTSSGGSIGALIGWDFGDIFGAANARLLVGWDIEIFANGLNWTENMATYLGSAQVEAVPEPATLLLLGSGLLAAGYLRRRSGWRAA